MVNDGGNHLSNASGVGAPGDAIEGISLERWHERNLHHQKAMEVRRSIQLKVFTGCVAFLAGLAKWGHSFMDANQDSAFIWLVLSLCALAVPAFLYFFMWQVERVNKHNREWYQWLETKIDAHLTGQEFTKVPPPIDSDQSREAVRENVRPWANPTDPQPRESWPVSIVRSWAGTWPVVATTVLAGLEAWSFIFVKFSF